MSVIALHGIRGGSGTSSVIAGLAWALQNHGESVLVIDFSPENILRLFFNMSYELSRGWARAVIDGIPWQESAMRYTSSLDFLPFGNTSKTERLNFETQFSPDSDFWQHNLSQLIATRKYNWILLDIPTNNPALTRNRLAMVDQIICILNPDMPCHIRLHQQGLPDRCKFLVNKYNSSSQLQQDLLQLWQNTLPDLLPLLIHRDEVIAEALAVKQPPGEYGTTSLATEELMTLAKWCLINFVELTS